MIELMINLEDCIIELIGRQGNLVSGSKSCGPPMAVYNSNLVVEDRVLWYGDLDLDKHAKILNGLAKLFDITIDIYREMDVRVFPFEAESEDEKIEKHRVKIKRSTPVYSTSDPTKFCGVEWDKIRDDMIKYREDRIRERQIIYGILTPNGTEWTWYNRWYYNYPHRVYRSLRYFYKSFIGYPLEYLTFSEEKRSLIQNIKLFLHRVVIEVGYHRSAYKKGELGTLRQYLLDH